MQTSARPTHGICYGLNCFGLANDPLRQNLIKLHQPITLALHHFFHRNASPARHNARNILLAHFLLYRLSGGGGIEVGQGGFKLWDDPIPQLASPGEVTLTFCNIGLASRVIQFFLCCTYLSQFLFVRPPNSVQIFAALFQFFELDCQAIQSRLATRIAFFFQRRAFNFHLQDTAIKLINFDGLAIDLHPHKGRCLVHQIDGLVREKTV